MPKILAASDSPAVLEQIESALVRPGFEIQTVTRGQEVVPIVAADPPDLVILDMQIGNMGGMATTLELRLEASGDRCQDVPVLLLLDREADRFLARRAQAEALLVKPFDPGTLRRTVKRLLDAWAARPAEEAEAASGGDDVLPGTEEPVAPEGPLAPEGSAPVDAPPAPGEEPAGTDEQTA